MVLGRERGVYGNYIAVISGLNTELGRWYWRLHYITCCGTGTATWKNKRVCMTMGQEAV